LLGLDCGWRVACCCGGRQIARLVSLGSGGRQQHRRDQDDLSHVKFSPFTYAACVGGLISQFDSRKIDAAK
jgi:hypothetical protein